MSETKACTLTEDEIVRLIKYHGARLSNLSASDDQNEIIDRINYLNKRLKSFEETKFDPNKDTAKTAKGWPTDA